MGEDSRWGQKRGVRRAEGPSKTDRKGPPGVWEKKKPNNHTSSSSRCQGKKNIYLWGGQGREVSLGTVNPRRGGRSNETSKGQRHEERGPEGENHHLAISEVRPKGRKALKVGGG